MKRFYFLALMLILSTQGFSQTFIGVKFEPGFANLLFWNKDNWGFQNHDQEIRSRFAISGGLEVTKMLTEEVGVRTGLFLVDNGYKTYYFEGSDRYPVRTDRMHVTYFSVPFEMVVNLNNFYISFGPNINYLLDNKRTFSHQDENFEYTDIPNFGFGLRVEPGVQFRLADHLRGYTGVFMRHFYNGKGNLNYGFTAGLGYNISGGSKRRRW